MNGRHCVCAILRSLRIFDTGSLLDHVIKLDKFLNRRVRARVRNAVKSPSAESREVLPRVWRRYPRADYFYRKDKTSPHSEIEPCATFCNHLGDQVALILAAVLRCSKLFLAFSRQQKKGGYSRTSTAPAPRPSCRLLRIGNLHRVFIGPAAAFTIIGVRALPKTGVLQRGEGQSCLHFRGSMGKHAARRYVRARRHQHKCRRLPPNTVLPPSRHQTLCSRRRSTAVFISVLNLCKERRDYSERPR